MSNAVPHPGEQTLEERRCSIPGCNAAFTGGVSGWILDDLFVGPYCSDYHYLKGCILALQQRCKDLMDLVETEQKSRRPGGQPQEGET